jgi:hypothetical protein
MTLEGCAPTSEDDGPAYEFYLAAKPDPVSPLP